MTLPYLHRPHDSGPIQWARGDVGLKSPPPLRAKAVADVAKFIEINRICLSNMGV